MKGVKQKEEGTLFKAVHITWLEEFCLKKHPYCPSLLYDLIQNLWDF